MSGTLYGETANPLSINTLKLATRTGPKYMNFGEREHTPSASVKKVWCIRCRKVVTGGFCRKSGFATERERERGQMVGSAGRGTICNKLIDFADGSGE